MSYKVFATTEIVSPADYLANKSRLVPKGYPDLDNALRFARQINEAGGKAWEIECPDGTVLGRDQIAEILRRRRAELSGPPTVY